MHVAELELHAQSRQRAKRSTQAPSVLECSCAGIHVVELELRPNGVFTHISAERFNLSPPHTPTRPYRGAHPRRFETGAAPAQHREHALLSPSGNGAEPQRG